MNWVGITTLYHWHLKRTEAEQGLTWFPLPAEQLIKGREEIEKYGVRVVFDRVSFGWEQSAVLLKDISFEIQQGQILLITGPSGSGKSSLLSLALGLHKPTTGTVSMNGMSPAVFFENFAEFVAYAGPEPMLIPGTFRSNLLFGLSRPCSDVDLNAALRAVDLEAYVNALPQQIDTRLSERTELSTGQKQRLSLARALLRKPKILVLDEVTANLDIENNQRIVDIISEQAPEMTVLIVSHRSGFEKIAHQAIHLGSVQKD